MQGKQKKWVGLLSVLFMVAGLVACGGGGGGGVGIIPVAYTGVTSQATIDNANAPEFAGLAENGVLAVETAPAPAPVIVSVTGGSSESVKIPVPVIQTIFDLGLKAPQYLEGKDLGQENVAAYTETIPYDCAVTGSYSESLYINEYSADFSMTLTFYDCDEGTGDVLNGGITVSANLINFDPLSAPATMNMSINNLEVYYQGLDQTVTTYAVVTMTQDESLDNPYYPNPYYNMLISDLIIADSTNVTTSRISNYDLTMIDYTSTLGYQKISINSLASMARVYHVDHGYVDFYTEEPIQDDGTGPSQGIIYMKGDNNISARIDFSLTCPNGALYYTDTDSPTGDTFCYSPAP